VRRIFLNIKITPQKFFKTFSTEIFFNPSFQFKNLTFCLLTFCQISFIITPVFEVEDFRQGLKLRRKICMIKPLGDRVIIEVAEVELKTKSGIIMPETSKEKPQKGKVIAVGTGKLLDNGTRAVPEVKEGDEVLFNKYAGSEVKVDEKDYLVIRESDILAIL